LAQKGSNIRALTDADMAKKFITKFLPDREKLEKNRFLRWLGPTLLHPSLWHINRRSIAIGLAIGVFMGLIIPLAQIPFAAVVAVFLRANLPVAVVSTLVTNPFTFAPLYFMAYRIGAFLMGERNHKITEASLDMQAENLGDGLNRWTEKISELGEPLILGLVIMAVVGAVVSYILVRLLWRLQVMWRLWQKRRRAKRRAA
jgi:uncharacterized protein (DUF2062 family)